MTLNFICIIATIKTVDISKVIAVSVTSLVFIALLCICGGILIRLLQLKVRNNNQKEDHRKEDADISLDTYPWRDVKIQANISYEQHYP